MDKKEIKITIPEGYEIDKENSTFEKIVFKKKQEFESWRNKPKGRVEGFHFDEYCSCILEDYTHSYDSDGYYLFATGKQAKSMLAMARLSQIMKNDERFGGVVTDEEWHANMDKYVITRRWNLIVKGSERSYYYFLAFHTKKQRDLFLKENEDLIKDYFMLD
jgi:hypothetical protein